MGGRTYTIPLWLGVAASCRRNLFVPGCGGCEKGASAVAGHVFPTQHRSQILPPRSAIFRPVLPLHTCGRYSHRPEIFWAKFELTWAVRPDAACGPCVSIESGLDFGVVHRVLTIYGD